MFTIGHQRVFSLRRWSAQIPPWLHEPQGTRVPSPIPPPFAYGAFTLSGAASQAASARLGIRHPRAPQPRPDKPDGLGSSPFARRYSGSRFRFPLLWVLRCFSSPGSPRTMAVTRVPTGRVSPFGHPGIHARYQLPLAYRRQPRPSSARVPRHPPWALSILTLTGPRQTWPVASIHPPQLSRSPAAHRAAQT